MGQFVDHTDGLRGKPARTAGQIRAAVKAIRKRSADPVEVGEHVAGLGADEWIVVAAASGGCSMRYGQQLLHQHGIGCLRMPLACDEWLEVRRGQFHKARHLLDLNRTALRAARKAGKDSRALSLGRTVAACAIGAGVSAVTFILQIDPDRAPLWLFIAFVAVAVTLRLTMGPPPSGRRRYDGSRKP